MPGKPCQECPATWQAQQSMAFPWFLLSSMLLHFMGATDALAVGVEADQMSVPGHHSPCQKDSAAGPDADTALEP